MPVANLRLDEEEIWEKIVERRQSYLGQPITPELLQHLFDESLIYSAMFSLATLQVTQDEKVLKVFIEAFGRVLESSVEVFKETQDNLPPDILN